MKILLVVVLAMIGFKYIGDTSQVIALANQYKDLIIAILITLAARPLLKRLFE